MLKNLVSRGRVVALALVGGAVAPVFAAGPDMTALTAAVDFGTVTTGVLAVSAILAVVYVAIKGARIMLGMIRR